MCCNYIYEQKPLFFDCKINLTHCFTLLMTLALPQVIVSQLVQEVKSPNGYFSFIIHKTTTNLIYVYNYRYTRKRLIIIQLVVHSEL